MAKQVKVRVLIPISGLAEPRYAQPAFSYSLGQIVLIDSRLADMWIASGKAEKVDKFEAVTEAAVLAGEENAMQQRIYSRRRAAE